MRFRSLRRDVVWPTISPRLVMKRVRSSHQLQQLGPRRSGVVDRSHSALDILRHMAATQLANVFLRSSYSIYNCKGELLSWQCSDCLHFLLWMSSITWASIAPCAVADFHVQTIDRCGCWLYGWCWCWTDTSKFGWPNGYYFYLTVIYLALSSG